MAAKRPKKGERPPPAADDDAWLWQAVTGDVTPLKRRKRAPARTPQEPGARERPATAEGAKREPAREAPAKAPPAPKREESAETAPGQAAGLDKRTAQKLRRGLLPIEAELDLHGMTQAEARPRLDGFLARAQARGLRCVRVITGIGRVREEGGVLRAAVPRWLDEPPNRARVLAFNLAQPKDGGHGALYVLLRKKREG